MHRGHCNFKTLPITNYQLPNGPVKAGRRWSQGANLGANGILKFLSISLCNLSDCALPTAQGAQVDVRKKALSRSLNSYTKWSKLFATKDNTNFFRIHKYARDRHEWPTGCCNSSMHGYNYPMVGWPSVNLTPMGPSVNPYTNSSMHCSGLIAA